MAKSKKDETEVKKADIEENEAEKQNEEEISNEVKLEKELAEQKERTLRILAEYDNFRKRSQREKDELYVSCKSGIISDLLPVIDNFERAALNSETTLEDYKKGIDMIYMQFISIIEKLGIESFGKPGDQFDANLHDAVMHIEDENFGESVVADVFSKGYKMGDKVIRHAAVKVAN